MRLAIPATGTTIASLKWDQILNLVTYLRFGVTCNFLKPLITFEFVKYPMKLDTYRKREPPDAGQGQNLVARNH